MLQLTPVFEFVRYIFSVFRSLVLAVTILLIVSGLLEGLGMSLLYPLIQVLTGGDGASDQWLSRFIISCLEFFGLSANTGSFLVAILIVFLLQYASTALLGLLAAKLQNGLVATFRKEIIDSFVDARWGFFTDQSTGQLLTTFMSETQRLGSCIYSIVQILSTIVVAGIYILLSLHLSWPITIALILAAILLAFVGRPLINMGVGIGEKLSIQSKSLMSRAEEFISMAKMLKVTSTGRGYANDIKLDINEFEKTNVQLSFYPVLLRVFLEFFGLTFLTIALVYGSELETVDAATMIVVLGLFARLYPRLSQLQQHWQLLLMNVAAWESVREMERVLEEHAEGLSYGRIPQPSCGHQIVFDNVSAGYDGVPVIKNLSLEIPAGSHIALVGPSGAGKSTFVDCIVGLLSARSGRVLIDGLDIKDLPLGSWREQVGYVGQDTLLLNRSIAENISWGAKELVNNDIVEMAKAASAHDFISALPDGYDTQIGQRGVRLSGGQKQRIGIARALNRQKGLIILDEATSALDSTTEASVLETINALQGSVTIISIAHRLSTVRDADKIIFLEGGEILEKGSWDELVGIAGRFKTMLDRQNGKDVEGVG